MDNTATATPELIGFKRDVHQLKIDIDDLRTDVGRLAGDALHTARVGAGEARARLGEGARIARIRGKQAVRVAEDEVTAHPFLAVSGAFVIGVLAGALIARRR